jgi:hypothetical protein
MHGCVQHTLCVKSPSVPESEGRRYGWSEAGTLQDGPVSCTRLTVANRGRCSTGAAVPCRGAVRAAEWPKAGHQMRSMHWGAWSLKSVSQSEGLHLQ